MVVSVPGVPNANITLTQAGASPYLSVDPHSQSVGYAAGTTNFTVSTNIPWSASSNSAWCTVTPSGLNSGILVATFSENTFAATRSANIIVTASGVAPVTVTVVQQAPVAFLNVTPATRTVTDPSGSTTFSVSANTTWKFNSDANWCQVTPSGSGIAQITATYQQNLTQVVRTANIQVNGTGTAPVTVQVVQLPSFVSLNDLPETGIQLYPNPTSGLFVISNSSAEIVDMNITILDAKGKAILKKQFKGANSYTIDLSQAASGNYYVKIETGEKTHLMKVIVQ